MWRRFSAATLLAMTGAVHSAPDGPAWDLVIRGGTVYDGSGGHEFVADVAVKGDRIARISRHVLGHGKDEIDAAGKAVSPGFVNMLAHPEESLLIDPRALSDLVQGVTLEVMGEDSMGPLSAAMKAYALSQQGDLKYAIDWTTLGDYLDGLQKRGVSPNVASFVGAGTVRENLFLEESTQPSPEQVARMRGLVRQAMEEGALGVTTALIYAPNTYAKTPELVALAQESARCGGMYIAHIRSEGDRLLEAVDETIEIAKQSGAPAEIYHFKQSGRDNWSKLDAAIARIEAARAAGVRITADMYTYVAGATGLDAAMPTWVQEGGYYKWAERLKDPVLRAKVIGEMQIAHPADWENLMAAAGPDGTLMLAFKNAALKPYTGMTLAAVAKERNVSPQEAAIELVIEDGTRVGVAYFLMSEDNIRREVTLPWMSFGSDEAAPAPEGAFLKSHNHPRAYGNFARVLARYVRAEHRLSLAEAVRKLSAAPAQNLSLRDRGLLKAGYFADVVVFDPNTVQDHATFSEPAQLATGVDAVIINGRLALRDGKATGAPTGRVLRGRAWTGAPGGGCRKSSAEWTWSN
jgi:N-acyl-D-amino-acid deacylase